MANFSKRNGYISVENVFQREMVDLPLRTKLWNVLIISFWDKYNYEARHYDENTKRVLNITKRMWFHYFNKDLDALPEMYEGYGRKGIYDIFKENFFKCEWYEVYDFLEEMFKEAGPIMGAKAKLWVNQVLEAHNSAYRFVGDIVSEITDENQIDAISHAMEIEDANVRAHINSAARMLSDRESPDYRNSIKESISAIEAACRELSGKPSSTLGEALKHIKHLHPAMSKAFSLLYGYTNDSSGIRHSLTEQENVSYSDAKFMLVACSAFASYLKESEQK